MTEKTLKLPIYFDYQATTPLDPQVLEAMLPFLTEKFGNPHSVEHSYGWEADAAIEFSRGQVASLIGAIEEEIVFTSGATESNNIAIKGVAFAHHPIKNHIITVNTEHECVLGCSRSLGNMGFDVSYLEVDKLGMIDLDILRNTITDKTSLVSVMALNNEIGVIQQLEAIGQICKDRCVIFHTDAAQAVGKIRLDVDEMNIDVMSISGHKLYGPKGIGAIYIRKGTDIIPLFDGGGQERGFRSGTLSPALCVGLGKACNIAGINMYKNLNYVKNLSERLFEKLSSELKHLKLNGCALNRYPGNLNFTFSGVNSNLLVADLRDIAISSGSACSSAKHQPSYVLKAIGLTKLQIEASIRIGIGHVTTVDEIDYAADHIIECVKNLS